MPFRPQPDPAQGIFETMLVVGGAPVAPDAHLARLQASVEAAFAASLPAHTERLMTERAAGLTLGRLRLTAIPPGSGESAELRLEVDAGELGDRPHFPERPLALRSHPVSGGLGCHKWADRAALPSPAAGEAPLLVDGTEVLEAAWANVFAVRTGALFTPPLDGRILPGVTRGTVIELAREHGIETIERPLSLDQLAASDEVFLTNSIRGIETVDSVDDTHLVGERPLAELLSEALRRRWKSGAAAPKDGRSLPA